MVKLQPPPIQLLPAFEAVARHLSFKQAAVELHVTPSAISQQVKNLEGQLDTMLFERQTRAVKLTAIGHQYFKLASELLNHYREGHANIQQSLATPTIRLSTVPQVAYDVLIPALPAFYEMFPHFDLRIETSDTLVDLTTDPADAAIRLGSGVWEGLTSRKLCDMQACALVSAGFLQNNPVNETVPFAGWPLIHSRSHVDDWRRAADSFGFDISKNKQLFFESALPALNAAENGLGVTLALLPFSQNRIDDGRLQHVFNYRADLPEACYLVGPLSKPDDPKMNALFDWLQPLFHDLQLGGGAEGPDIASKNHSLRI